MRSIVRRGVQYIGAKGGRWWGPGERRGFDVFTIKDDVESIPHQTLVVGQGNSVLLNEVECAAYLDTGTRWSLPLQLDTQILAPNLSHLMVRLREACGYDEVINMNTDQSDERSSTA